MVLRGDHLQTGASPPFSAALRKLLLLGVNLLLVILAIVSAVIYSNYIHRVQIENRTDSFISTVETMKDASRHYLDTERGYAQDWAAYISGHDMTMDQALDYIRAANTNPDRYAHIIDMDTYAARTTFYPNGSDSIAFYQDLPTKDIDYNRILLANMDTMFNDGDQLAVLGKYRLDETHAFAVSVGTSVTLRTEAGAKRYLLLRVIPIEAIKKTWLFPTEYASAEISLITQGGDYVIPSASMRASSLYDYIRNYNFRDDYNKVEDLLQTLRTTDQGTLYYQDYRKQDCLWYYSAFDDASGLDILGVVPRKDLESTDDYAWVIVALTCGPLVLLTLLDGAYLYSINRRLRETAALAERASQAKTHFLSAMSHDIRTPMNAVLGMTDIALHHMDNPAYVTDCLNKSLQAGKHLLTLINDVLDISKVESGKMTLLPAVCGVDQFIPSLTAMFQGQLEEKHLTLTTHCPPLPHPYVMADELRVNQIYINLLTNALKYTAPGGKISLSLWEENSPQPGCTRLIYQVADNGMGMSEEFQQTMYESFSRATSTQINTIQGSGLGLSIVKQMVDLMGGTIDCRSAIGQGTTFTVILDLPIAAPAQRPSDADEADEAVAGMHVLVAEDNDINWEIVQTMLAAYDVTSQRAENGQIAVDALTAAPAGTFDGVFMDVQMPVLNGRDATRKIRALAAPALASIPVVAMTADAFAEDVQACLDCGMNGHIAKPIDTKKLLYHLQQMHAQHPNH